MSGTSRASGSTSPSVPSDVSICWQKPCVVVIVAASNSASATVEALRPRGTVGAGAAGR